MSHGIEHPVWLAGLGQPTRCLWKLTLSQVNQDSPVATSVFLQFLSVAIKLHQVKQATEYTAIVIHFHFYWLYFEAVLYQSSIFE